MTRQILPLAVLLVLGACGLYASAQPDLVVVGIASIPATPIAGERATLLATIENVGSQDTGQPFYVTFEVDGEQIDVAMVSQGLRAGRSTSVTVYWHATVGSHVVTVQVDEPFNRISELDEGNNVESAVVVVGLSNVAAEALAPFKVVVARFDDYSGSPFANIGEGVADKLIERLLAAGARVLERFELEAIMQERGLNPALSSDVSVAGQLLGADLLIAGSVADIDVRETSFNLPILNVNTVSVDVVLSARLVNVHTSEVLSAFSREGHDEGSTTDFGPLLSFVRTVAAPPCAPGFLTGSPWYGMGQAVPFGYQNPGAGNWFGVEIYTATGTFLRWLGWEFIDLGNCGAWTWDQRDAGGVQLSPDIYTAKLWDGAAYIATVDFQIRPGISLILPLIEEITVGTSQFNSTVVGSALDQAVDQIAASVLDSMESAAPMLLAAQEAMPGAPMMAPSTERIGQIAAILPDGRLAINIGASVGVTEGEFFEVIEAVNVIVDPQSHEILAFDVVGVRGEIVVIEVRDRVSYGMPTSEFVFEVGDVVRWRAP